MGENRIKIGIVATGNRIERELADRVSTIASELFPQSGPELVFHPHCFLSSGHFAGDDDARASAFLEMANDPSVNAVWFAKGGYGSARLLDKIMPHLASHARAKSYLGYSDSGAILAALYGAGFESVAHGPMPTDLNRSEGPIAIKRGLQFLTRGDTDHLESSLLPNRKYIAMNLTTLCHLIGTPYMPDLSGHILMIEEVAEYMYAIDRYLCHLANAGELQTLSGLQMGRCSLIPDNDPDFGMSESEVARHWCSKTGIRYLGQADIGHDTDNKIVPFGEFADRYAS